MSDLGWAMSKHRTEVVFITFVPNAYRKDRQLASRALAHSGSALGSVRLSLLTTLPHHCRAAASIQGIVNRVYFVCDAYSLDAYPRVPTSSLYLFITCL